MRGRGAARRGEASFEFSVLRFERTGNAATPVLAVGALHEAPADIRPAPSPRRGGLWSPADIRPAPSPVGAAFGRPRTCGNPFRHPPRGGSADAASPGGGGKTRRRGRAELGSSRAARAPRCPRQPLFVRAHSELPGVPTSARQSSFPSHKNFPTVKPFAPFKRYSR